MPTDPDAPPLAWTRTPPREPGWWWLKQGFYSPCIVKVERYAESAPLKMVGGGYPYNGSLIADLDQSWLWSTAPIPEPESEARDAQP